MQDKFQYLESNKLCTFSALFWLEFSSQYGDDLCGLLDSYSTLRRGLVGGNLDFCPNNSQPLKGVPCIQSLQSICSKCLKSIAPTCKRSKQIENQSAFRASTFFVELSLL
jgi:hypothetical protein